LRAVKLRTECSPCERSIVSRFK